MAAPMYPLFPSKGEVDEIIAQAKAQLPITTPNELTAVLATFSNALQIKFTHPYWNPESPWDDHEECDPDSYREEVFNGDTRQSYIDWVNSCIDDKLGDG